MTNKFEKIAQELKSYKKIAVFSHIRPDGDAIGSQVALCLWLKQFGIEVWACNDDRPPDNMKWLSSYFPLTQPDETLLKQMDAFVVLDGNTHSRFGKFGEQLFSGQKPLYMIDHHPNPNGPFTNMISVTSASSTAELVYKLIASEEEPVFTQEMCKSIYTGLVTDTGSFRFDSVNSNVLNIASEILRIGQFAPPDIYEKVYDNRNVNQIQLLGKALTTVDAPRDGKIGIIKLKKSFFEETGTNYSHTEGFVAYALSLKGVIAAVLFAEIDGKIKLSLRSKRDINCNLWADYFGGGGHERASGAWFEGVLDDAVEQVLDKGYDLMTN